MRNELPSGVALELLLEEAEQEVTLNFYRGMPDALSRDCNITHARMGNLLRLTARTIDRPMFNRVMGLGVGAPATEAQLDSVIAHYQRTLGMPRVERFMIQVLPHVQTPELETWLALRGLKKLRGWAMFLGSTATPTKSEPSLRIERVLPSECVLWGDICVRALGMPENLRPWLQSLRYADWNLYLGYDGDTPVSCGGLHLGSNFATLAFGASLPHARGQGWQSAMIMRRIADAGEAGYRHIVTVTEEQTSDHPNPCYRNLERFGLQVQFVRSNWGPSTMN